MIKAVNYWTFGPKALEGKVDIGEAMEKAAKAGFEGIELCIGPDGELTPSTSEKRCKEIIATAKDIGIQIIGVATGFYWGKSLTASKASTRNAALKFTKDALQVCSYLKAKTFLCIPGVVQPEFDPSAEVVPYDFVYKTAVSQAKNIGRTAEKLRVTVCMENVWNMFMYSPLEWLTFFKTVNNRYIRMYFDPGNVVKNGYPEHWVPILGRYIKRVHCKDYKKGMGFPEGFEIPIGKGDCNWPAVLKELKKAKYGGPLTAEIISFDPPKNLVKNTSKQMDKIMGRS